MSLCAGCVGYLYVSDQELRRCFHRCFGVNDLLDGTRPVHGLVEVLAVQPVAVLSAINCDAPVAWKKHTHKKETLAFV